MFVRREGREKRKKERNKWESSTYWLLRAEVDANDEEEDGAASEFKLKPVSLNKSDEENETDGNEEAATELDNDDDDTKPVAILVREASTPTRFCNCRNRSSCLE
jgi:hypothetical protein